LEYRARKLLAEENVPEDRIVLERAADLRYEGQSYELTIPIKQTGNLDQGDVAQLIADFHNWHDKIYAYQDPAELVEFISLRLAAIGKVPELEFHNRLVESDGQESSEPRPKSERPVYFPATGFGQTRIYERDQLQPGSHFTGPCLVEESTSTTVIPPGWSVRTDAFGNIVAKKD
jgi:N-methylhydantoinase A